MQYDDVTTNFAILKLVLSLYFSHESSDFNQIWCAYTQILIPRTVTWQSVKILQIQNGGLPPYGKSVSGYISRIYCPINTKIGMKNRITLRHR